MPGAIRKHFKSRKDDRNFQIKMKDARSAVPDGTLMFVRDESQP
jgi:hypothetical protein